jgi:trimeric autotransporter adhesin
MPSTFSPLKIELPATGEQSGTWGNTTNTNLGTALEEAITGSANVTFASGNVVLTLTDTNASQVARNLRLNLIGVTGGSTRTLTVPAIKKLYLVSNNCADSVIVGNSTGATVTVPAGNNIFVYNDGTDVLNAITYITNLNAVAVSAGTVTTTQVDIASQGDLRLQDTTGGQYVALQAPGTIATSYTLTLPVDDGTNGQALITDGNGVLSWSTAASGDVYGPASATDNAIARFDLTTGKIIQNSVVTIADTTGDMAGVGTLSSGAITTTGVLTVPAGTVSAPAITTTGDTNTGIFFPAADTIAFAEGGGESMRIDASGNLGIGTTSPAGRLDSTSATTQAFLSNGTTLANTTGTVYSTIAFRSLRGGGAGSFGFDDAWIQTQRANLSFNGDAFTHDASLVFFTNNSNRDNNPTERMRITSTGNVGIGLTSTQARLSILQSLSGTYGSAGIWLTDNATTSLMINNTASGVSSMWSSGAIAFGTGNNNNTERMRIDSSGNVGIGTSSPAVKFVVSNGGAGGVETLTDGTIQSYNRSTSAYQTLRLDGSTLLFRPSGTEAMRLDASGNLGLGVTPSAWAALKAMQFAGGASLGGFSNVAFLNANAYFDGSWRYLATAGTGRYEVADTHKWFTAPSGTAGNAITYTQSMTLDPNGNLGVGTSTITGAANTNIQVKNSAAAALRVTGGSGTGFDVLQASDSVAYLYNRDNTAIVFGTNNAERMRILSDGNVAIGATTAGTYVPASSGKKLYIVGDVLSEWNTNRFMGSTFQDGSDYKIGMELDANSRNLNLICKSPVAGGGTRSITFLTGATPDERMRIDSSGNVGINNSSPTYRLDSMGSLALGTSARSGLTVATTTGMYVYQTNNGGSFEIAAAVGGTGGPSGVNAVTKISFFASNTDISTVNAIPITIGTNGSERMRITSAGNVGVGVTNPTQKLDVAGNLVLNAGGGNTYLNVVSGTSSLQVATDGTTQFIYGSGAVPLTFSTNASERMRIHSSGGVSIGNSTDPGINNLSVTGAVIAQTAFRETNGLSNIANGATFNITIPTVRRPQLLTVYSTYNLYQPTLALVVGDNSSNASVFVIVNGGGVTLAGTATNIVRVTNGLGGTANIYWSLLPLGVGV